MKKNKNKQHFSHHHILIPLHLDSGEQIDCEACEELISEPFHGCLSCNFYLHDGCADAPRSLDHPSHPTHPLTLLPTPTYPSGSFTCNACGSPGNAYSFSCARCEFDIHVQCACTPDTILVEDHPHELKMIFGSPCEDKSAVFSCDMCDGLIVDPDQWLYYCEACDFGVHLGCTDSKGKDSRKATKDEEESSKPKVSGKKKKKKSFGDGKVGSRDSREESERAMFEAQRKMRGQRIAHKAMLEALDNAADYVGPSYTREYYYY